MAQLNVILNSEIIKGIFSLLVKMMQWKYYRIQYKYQVKSFHLRGSGRTLYPFYDNI